VTSEDALFDVEPQMRRAATISGCGRYRYRLSRAWGTSLPAATFIMLNPSTADADVDDPTIRRCIGYARAWGCGALVVVNLYAWRATDPAELAAADDPVGPRNDESIARAAAAAARRGEPLVAAWGANATPQRVAHVLALPGMGRLTALALCKNGQPRHPLYLPAGITPQPWGPRPGPQTPPTGPGTHDVVPGVEWVETTEPEV